MKKIIAILVALVMALSLCACGGGGTTADPNVGRYLGDQVNFFEWEPMSNIYDAGENYLDLLDGGKGTLCLDGDGVDLTWKLDGDQLTMTIETEDITATLADGTITIEDFLGTGLGMTFVKEGAEGAQQPADDGADDGDTAPTTGGAFDSWTQSGVTFSAPTDTFKVDGDAVYGDIFANDESVLVDFMPISEDLGGLQAQYDKEDAVETAENYTDFSKSETTVAGYAATLYTYFDASLLADEWNAVWIIDFGGENANGYTGVVARAVSAQSLDVCTSDAILGILGSLVVD